MFFSFVIYPLTQIIEFVFSFCNKIFSNTGISIIGVSCAVSLLTLPLYVVAENWMQVERNIQKKMKPEVDKIKTVFKGNEQYMILSTYYRQMHYHPIMSLRSAFGLLIQIPFFTAAYTCLSNMTALQGESFLFIKNMGSPDALFSIGSFNVNVLPIAMTLINMISGTIYTKGLSIRDKLQTYGLALVFVVLLYNSPAGLVMYWTMNNIFSLVKNIFYKLKNPIKTLYFIACSLVTIFIVWLFAGHILSTKRAILISTVFSLVYLAPFIVKVCNYFIDNTFSYLKNDFKRRLFLFLTSTITLCVLIGLLIPSMLINSSPEEFCGIDNYGNPNFFIFNTFIQSIGIFIVWCSLIYFLFKERIQTILCVLLTILVPICFLNVFAFSEKYGTLSKLLVFTNVTSVDSSIKAIIINCIILLTTILVLFFLLKLKLSKILSFTYLVVGFSSFSFSINTLSKISNVFNSYEEKISQSQKSNSEITPIFHLSKTGKNVLFIYLDCAQNRFLEPLLEECTELQTSYKGFTLFKNTVSFNSHTLIGAVPVFGGYEYTPEQINKRKEETLIEKQNQALLLLPRIFTEQGNNFSATVTDPTWSNYSWTPDLTIYKPYSKIKSHLTDKVYLDKWYKENQDKAELNVTSSTLKRNMLWFSFFRISPLFLRPAFYNDGNYWSSNKKNKDFNSYLEGYSVLDYLIKLTDFNAETENIYINFVNNTTHDQMNLSAPDYRPSSKDIKLGTSIYANEIDYQSFAGALKRVGEWFDYLQKNECYDNTRIVIVADHGALGHEIDYKWDSSFDLIRPEKYHPLLMFKDFNENEKLKISNEFMTNADVASLLTNKIIESPVNPFTNKKLDTSNKNEGVLICTDDIFMPYHNKSDFIFTAKQNSWYRVKDNIFDSSNWTLEEKND